MQNSYRLQLLSTVREYILSLRGWIVCETLATHLVYSVSSIAWQGGRFIVGEVWQEKTELTFPPSVPKTINCIQSNQCLFRLSC